MFDIIGDIHGHADALKRLLLMMGYQPKGKGFKHHERQVLFVGDYIDRGPQIKRTLEIVRHMQGSGDAIALMGNHEYNALCFNEHDPKGGHLRRHLIKNIKQHYKTLMAFKHDQRLYHDYLQWFTTLPLFYENEHLRAVHACWDDKTIDFLSTYLQGSLLKPEYIVESAIEGNPLFHAVDQTLKGVELPVPNGLTYRDEAEKQERNTYRVKWWENPLEHTHRSYSLTPIDVLPTTPVPDGELKVKGYTHHKPIFFGHYWLRGTPVLQQRNVCCVDFSVAKKGLLTAYRFDGSSILRTENFVSVSA